MQLLSLPLFLFIVGFGLSIWAAAFARPITSVRTWMFFVVPGTMAHELAHYLVAIVTGGRPEPISLWPRRNGDGGWVMGSVVFRPNLFNGALVALAPLYLLPPLAWWCGLQHVNATPLAALGWGYLTAVLLYSAWPSSVDWKISLRYPAAYLLLLPVVLNATEKL
jgi:hypothetical protein